MGKPDKVREFFAANSLLSGNNRPTPAADGTGCLPSVGPGEADVLAGRVPAIAGLADPLWLDFGTGVGHLVNAGSNIFGVEGSSGLWPHIVGDRGRIAMRAATDVYSPLLYKAFDLSTSFEVVEHVPREAQNEFWRAVFFVADVHVCSIHTANDEHANHRTVVGDKAWLAYFAAIGVAAEQLDCPVPHWNCSAFFRLTRAGEMPEPDPDAPSKHLRRP